MKRTTILYLFLSMLMVNGVFSQITISPEIGITYSPYEIQVLDGIREANLLFGIIGEVQIIEKLSLRTRFSYNNMSDIKEMYRSITGIVISKYQQSNLNIDLGIYYKLNSKFQIPNCILVLDLLGLENYKLILQGNL